MAELVRDDALQLISVQAFERAPRHGNRGVVRRVAGCKCIDAGFFLEHENIRCGNAGCDRHFFDDVPVAAPERILSVRIDGNAAHGDGDLRTAGRQ